MVQGLFEDHTYEFRVSAVNENGIGPSLIGEEPIVAQLPFGKVIYCSFYCRNLIMLVRIYSPVGTYFG